MEFIRDIWGGHDYIPQVWDDWIRDRKSPMFVVESDGRPVGMNRIRFLEDGTAWFEGARIHPGYRGAGLATMLGENSLRVAASNGVGVCRLTSNSRNRRALRQVTRMGFRELARLSIYSPREGTRFRRQDGVRTALPEEAGMVVGLIQGSREYRAGAGVMWDGFTAISLTPQVIRRRVDEGNVHLTDGAAAIEMPGSEGREVWTQLCFLCGEPKGAVKVAEHIFSGKTAVDWRLAYLPQGSPLVGALRREGFSRSFSLILFERKTKG